MAKIQRQGIKTQAEIEAAGGSISDLPRDTQIYVTANSLNKLLSAAITDGDIGGSKPTHYLLENLELATSVAGNALTIALKTAAGTDPTASDKIRYAVRSGTASSGVFNINEVTSAKSITVPAGATLGHTAGSDVYIYVYLVDVGGTTELAVSSIWRDEGISTSTTTISAASDDSALYSTGAYSNPIRLIARLRYSTAPNGTYSAVPNEVTLGSFQTLMPPREYRETEITSNTNTSTADAWTDVSGATISNLSPGTWEIGYQVTGYINSDGSTTVGNVVIATSGGDRLNKSMSMMFSGSAAGDTMDEMNRWTRVTITETTSYKLQVRCSRNSANAIMRVQGSTDYSGLLTNPDCSAIFWARRVS